MTTPEPTQLVWLALKSDFAYFEAARPDPKVVALTASDGFRDDETITVTEFKVTDVADMLPDDLFGLFLKNLSETLRDGYPDESAQGEMLNALSGTGSEKASEEVNALLRPAFEVWWRRHAARFGVENCYTATGRELTFRVEELLSLEDQ